MQAIAVDIPTSGFNTFTINCLRKWKFEEISETLLKSYIYVSATIKDVIRRFKKRKKDYS